MTLLEDFFKASEDVKMLPYSVSDNTKLKLYGLYNLKGNLDEIAGFLIL